MTYKEACNAAKEYGKQKENHYAKINVLEFEQEWWFTYIPEGENYTSCEKIAINKQTGALRRISLPVPPLENLKVYQQGKRIEFISE